GTRFILEDVIQVFLRERAALALVALAVRAFVKGGHPPLRTIQLACREAELPHTARLDFERCQSCIELPLLDASAQREGADRRTQLAAAAARGEERRVRLARELAEAVIEHLLEDVLDHAPAVVADQLRAFARALANQLHARL